MRLACRNCNKAFTVVVVQTPDVSCPECDTSLRIADARMEQHISPEGHVIESVVSSDPRKRHTVTVDKVNQVLMGVGRGCDYIAEKLEVHPDDEDRLPEELQLPTPREVRLARMATMTLRDPGTVEIRLDHRRLVFLIPRFDEGSVKHEMRELKEKLRDDSVFKEKATAPYLEPPVCPTCGGVGVIYDAPAATDRPCSSCRGDFKPFIVGRIGTGQDLA